MQAINLVEKGQRLRLIARRYAIFFVLGVVSELFGLLVFRLAEAILPTDFANAVSVVPAVAFSFLLHYLITWRDRPGSFLVKGGKFVGAKMWLLGVRIVVFPLWRRVPWFSCPLYGVAHMGAQITSFYLGLPWLGMLLHKLFSCGWMELALFDLSFALTLGFVINDGFVFRRLRWESGKKE